ncbi:MAG: ADP-ribosyltransferase [Oligoflexus sp.]
MAFDPDKYLASNKTAGFDPDAYLSVTEEIGKLESAARGGFQGASFGFADELAGGLEAIGRQVGIQGLGGSFSDIGLATPEQREMDFTESYREARDARRGADSAAQEANPGSYMTGDIAGGIVSGAAIPLGAAAKGASLASKVGTAAKLGSAFGAVEGLGRSEGETAGDIVADTALGGAFGGVAGAAMPVVGAGLKAVGRGAKKVAEAILPGMEGGPEAANRFAAKAASILPGNVGDSEDYYRLLSQPEMRRSAKKLASAKDIADDIGKELNNLKQSVQKSYQTAQSDFIKSGTPKSHKLVSERFKAFEKNVAEISDQLSPATKKAIKNAKEIVMDGVNPREQGSLTFKKPLKELSLDGQKASLNGKIKAAKKELSALGEIEHPGVEQQKLNIQSQIDAFKNALDDLEIPEFDNPDIIKQRLLDARRRVDDLLKNKKWENLHSNDTHTLTNLRKVINESLEAMPGGDEFRKQDKLWGAYREATDAFSKPITTKGEVDRQKLGNAIKSQTERGSVFADSIGDFKIKLENLGTKYGIPTQDTQRTLSNIEKIRELVSNQAFLDRMNYTSGGPTSQAVNTLLQAGAASATGGASLLALPMTNPVAWTRIIDGLASIRSPESAVLANLLSKVGDFSRKYPAMTAARQTAVSKVDESNENRQQTSAQIKQQAVRDYVMSGMGGKKKAIKSEPGLESEGFFDILRPFKDIAKDSAEKAGVPSWVTNTVDTLTPDGIGFSGAATALKKMIPTRKYKPSIAKDLPGDDEEMPFAIDEWSGHGYKDAMRRQKGLPVDSERETDYMLQGLNAVPESDLPTPSNIIRLHTLHPDESIPEILNSGRITSDTFKSFSTANPNDLANFGKAQLMFRVGNNKSGKDISKFSRAPHEQEILVPEGVEYLIDKVSKMPLEKVFTDPVALDYVKNYLNRQKAIEGRTDIEAMRDLVNHILVIDLLEK